MADDVREIEAARTGRPFSHCEEFGFDEQYGEPRGCSEQEINMTWLPCLEHCASVCFGNKTWGVFGAMF